VQTPTPRQVVWLAAGAAALSRFPGLVHPPSPDEAGYLYVAQHWNPSPASVFGPYFVDRSPILIGVFRLGDLLGGTPAVRLLAALGCALLVLAAAALAREITSDDRATAWTAVVTAALVGSAAIEPVIAKGEVLGIPLVVTALWLTLVAVRRSAAGPAFVAGLLSMTAVGLKQNLTTGLVFGAVYLVAVALTGRLTWPAFGRLSAAAAAGCALPVLGVVVWAQVTGVSLGDVWYAFYGFRTDATRALANGVDPDSGGRAATLVTRGFWGGLAPFALLFLLRVRPAWRTDRALTAAAVALFVSDGALLVLGGSWWRSYLFMLVPGTVVFVALLARDRLGWVWARRLGVYAVAASLAGAAFWAVQLVHPTRHDDPWSTGLAIGAASEPGDTIVAPSRPDLTAASGLEASYPYLWGLIQATLDPDLEELSGLLAGRNPPTWYVAVPPFSSLDTSALDGVLAEHYEPHGVSCAGTPIYLHRGIARPTVTPDCERTGY
jgi:hypothetical protein